MSCRSIKIIVFTMLHVTLSSHGMGGDEESLNDRLEHMAESDRVYYESLSFDSTHKNDEKKDSSESFLLMLNGLKYNQEPLRDQLADFLWHKGIGKCLLPLNGMIISTFFMGVAGFNCYSIGLLTPVNVGCCCMSGAGCCGSYACMCPEEAKRDAKQLCRNIAMIGCSMAGRPGNIPGTLIFAKASSPLLPLTATPQSIEMKVQETHKKLQ